jgi:hypothetical protein
MWIFSELVPTSQTFISLKQMGLGASGQNGTRAIPRRVNIVEIEAVLALPRPVQAPVKAIVTSRKTVRMAVTAVSDTSCSDSYWKC